MWLHNNIRCSGAFLAPVLALAVAAVLLPARTLAYTSADYQAVPPFLANAVAPNVLVILDNSNSMDEDVAGNAVGSAAANSRSEIARQAVLQYLVNANNGRMRLGLMAYQQSGVQRYYIHNSYYYDAYDPATYNPAAEPTPKDPAVNTQRFPNPVDAGRYIYYDQALPFYASSAQGNGFCYSYDYTENGNSLNDHYYCYSQKTGTADPPAGVSNRTTLQTSYGYGGTYYGNWVFAPTDEDYAAGFSEFGRQMGWTYVSPTWFSNSSPGKGYLHVPIADSDGGAHDTALTNKLGTSNFSTTAGDHPGGSLDTPLRNAGLTPLAGTLASARLYFQGSLAAAQGGPQASPAQYPCQKNFIILVTDGLPSVNQSGTPGDADSLLPDVQAQAAALRATTISGFTQPFDIQTYVLGFALPASLGSKLDDIAVAGGTAVDGHAYLADSADELAAALETIFMDILHRMSSSTSASVISNSRSGEGAIYQAVFFPSEDDQQGRVIKWAGDVQSLWLDKYGNMREDCGDAHTCEDPCAADCPADHVLDLIHDRIIELYTDDTGVARANRYSDANGDGQYTAADLLESGVGLRDIRFTWSAGRWLARLTDVQAISQRDYAVASDNRYIFTWFGDQASGGPVAFTPAELQLAKPANYYRYLKAANGAEAQNIINYIRGKDAAGYRSRQIDWDNNGAAETYKLGDIVHSTPTVVSAPAEDFDLIYDDPSYAAFRHAYANRRTMIYAGGNDGMLHAFNGGHYDRSSAQFLTAPAGKTGYELGAEMWAFIPYNLLPHLKWLANTSYSHIYYVDLKPKIFDAKIFDPNDGVHTGGWGTILAGGMGFGGGQIGIDTDGNGSDDTTLQSAFFLLDITNPECPPVILGEYTWPGLGFTTSYPSPFPMLRCDRGVTDPQAADYCGSSWPMDWYLALGSGPHPAQPPALASVSDQRANLYLLKLGGTTTPVYTLADSGSCPAVTAYSRPTLATRSHPRTNPITMTDNNSFISDLVSADFDLSFQSDAIYFGSVDGATGRSGAISRLKIADDPDPDQWELTTLLDVNKPVTGAPVLASDGQDFWVYFGTGRFFTTTDKSYTSQQSFYGLKEPRTPHHELSWGTYNNENGLLNVSTAQITNESGAVTGIGGVTDFTGLLTEISDSDGWRLDFPLAGERNLGQATALGGLLGFATYVPSTDPCTSEGSSYLYALYYRTGTSYYQSVMGVDGFGKVINKVSLGRGLAVSPNIHTGANDTSKSFIQTSTGAIIGVEQNNPGIIKSGPTSWKEIDSAQ